MNLTGFVAERKRKLFHDLEQGLPPSEGSYDDGVWREGKAKGRPQMGTTRFEPDAVIVEFLFMEGSSAAAILPVRLSVPERIVYLPVPSWVIEEIWQGEVSGSYHFESEALRLVAAFAELLEPDANRPLFGPKAPTRRE